MNIQYNLPSKPLRVLIVNPITDTGELLCTKIMRGITFGLEQMVDVILLVYSNELEQAEQFKYNLNICGFPCNNSITITCDLPSFSDADVFIFLTDFPSLNCLDFDQVTDVEVFDALYLLLKVATNLEWVSPPPESDELISIKKRSKLLKEKPRRPVIVVDGLIAMDILYTYTKNLPRDIFFCPTPISAVAKSVLEDYLKVPHYDVNRVYVWAANDATFHVEVARPIFAKDNSTRRHCEWEDMADIDREKLGFDITQFNPAWLKKDFIQKIKSMTTTNPHGPIFKSIKVSNLLRYIFKTRLPVNPFDEWYVNCGVISDGSMNTIKGLPYVLPIKIKEDSYYIEEYMKDDFYLKREIKLINKAVLEHHNKLIPYCNNFLESNVVQHLFVVKSSSLFESSASASTGSKETHATESSKIGAKGSEAFKVASKISKNVSKTSKTVSKTSKG